MTPFFYKIFSQHYQNQSEILINNMQTFNSKSFKKYTEHDNEMSTAQNFYNVDQSYKLYLQLMQENLQLKKQIEYSKVQRKEGQHSPLDQYQRTKWHHPNQQGHDHRYNYNQSRENTGYGNRENQVTYEHYNHGMRERKTNQYKNGQSQGNHYQINQEGRDIPNMNENTELPLYSMMQRNKYLENKMEKMRRQYERQHNSIKNIETSSKWRNKEKCQDGTCYHNKYLQLLKIRSPFY